MTAPLDGVVGLDLDAVRAWVAEVLGADPSLELQKMRSWATTLRVTAAGETYWFKACQPIQAFEPTLVATLATRWPDRLPRVLAFDAARAWLLTADAGATVGTLENAPEIWLRALPRYAELQRGEAGHAGEHLDHGVPDLRLTVLPERYEHLLSRPLPIGAEDLARLDAFGPTFGGLVADLATADLGESIQHDDLHVNSVCVRGDELRVIDWGDASIAHPFFSLVVTFWFLERQNGLSPEDPWFDRLRSAYLEPWGSGPGHRPAQELLDVLRLAERVGLVAHAIAWVRHRDAIHRGDARLAFDVHFAELLGRVVSRAVGPSGSAG